MGNGKAGLAVVASSVALAGCVVSSLGMGPGGSIGGVMVSSTPGPTALPGWLGSKATPTPIAQLAGGGAGAVYRPPSGGLSGGIDGPHGGIGGRPGGMSDALEEPLPIGGAILPLEPAPPLLANESEQVMFGNGSAFYVWKDDSGDNLMVGEAGGTIRRLGPWNRGNFWPRFTDTGRHVLVKDYASRPGPGEMSSPQRYLFYPLAGGEPLVAADLQTDAYYDPLPDGSGLTRLAVSQVGGPPANYYPTPSPVSAPAKSQLVIRTPGGQDVVEAELTATRHGVWSLDARLYASVGFRNSDPLQGMDIMVLDRATKQSRLLYHLETDYFTPAQEGNFRWTPDLKLAFAHRLQFGASVSISVTTVPADSRPAEISLFPLQMAPGDNPGVVLMSADARAVAFSVLRPTRVEGDGWSGTYPFSQGVWVCHTADGKVRQVAKRGRPVSWLPDGRTLICATGRGRYVRYYRVDTQAPEGGGQ